MNLKKNKIYLFQDKIYGNYFELEILGISKNGEFIKVNRKYRIEWLNLKEFQENVKLLDEVG
jgi:hypothetical protein